MIPAAFGLDIGGSSLCLAALDAGGAILQRAAAATPAGAEPAALLAAIERIATEVGVDQHASVPLGVALPGAYDAETGVVLKAVNLPGLQGFALRDRLRTHFGRPVHIHSDAVCAGWAQWQRIAPPPARFAYLSVGTGIGACVILDGAIVRHTRGGPGHLGHLAIESGPAARRCRCGGSGCVEAVVADCLARGDNPAAATALATAVVQVVHLYAVHCVAIGGGVIDARPQRLREIQGALDSRRTTLFPAEFTLAAGALASKDAGVIGSAQLAMIAQHEGMGR